MNMTCNLCGATIQGSIAEVLAWDKAHAEHCTTKTGIMTAPIHHFNDTGTAVVCTSPPDADCRKRTHCDSEAWRFDTGCTDHDGKHPALPGSDCWMAEYINAIELTETFEDYENQPEINPGAAIDLEFIGSDEGCCWAYAKEKTP